MINFFKKHPKPRIIYAVVKGSYLGELLVYIEKSVDNYSFLSLPNMTIREIPIEKFKFGIDEKIVEKVTKIPKYVYSVCKKQYFKNKQNTLNNIGE
jgi:hypothetical protein